MTKGGPPVPCPGLGHGHGPAAAVWGLITGLTWLRCSRSPSDASTVPWCQHSPCRDPWDGPSWGPAGLGGLGGSSATNPLPTERGEPPLTQRPPPVPALGLAVPWGLGIAASGIPPLPGWCGQDGGTGPHFAGIPLAPLQCCGDAGAGVLAVHGKGLVARSQPGAVRRCPPTLMPPSLAVGAAPRAQPGASSGDSAGASSPAAAQCDSGRRNPLSPGCSHRSRSPWHSPALGGAPAWGCLQGPGGTPHGHRHGPEQGQRGEGDLSPPEQSPHTVPLPPTPIQHLSRAMLVRERGQALRLVPLVARVAPGAKPGTLSGPRHGEAAAGLCGGLFLLQSIPLTLMGEVPSCYPRTGLQGLLAPRCSRTLSPASPRDTGPGHRCPRSGHAPSPRSLTVQPVIVPPQRG